MKGIGLLGVAALLAAAMAVAPALSAPAQRQAAGVGAGTETLGTAGAWSAYEARDATGHVCYLAGGPQKGEDAAGGRRRPMAMVTHRPAERIANVVSFVEGYPLKPGTNVALQIGERKFSLFVQGDSAWAQTSELDRAITAELARGRSAVVEGEAANGRRTTDVYVLAGFAKALALIDKACGLTPEQSVLPAPVVHAAPPRHHEVRKAAPTRPRQAHRPAHKAAVHKKPIRKKPVHKVPVNSGNPSETPTQAPPHPSD